MKNFDELLIYENYLREFDSEESAVSFHKLIYDTENWVPIFPGYRESILFAKNFENKDFFLIRRNLTKFEEWAGCYPATYPYENSVEYRNFPYGRYISPEYLSSIAQYLKWKQDYDHSRGFLPKSWTYALPSKIQLIYSAPLGLNHCGYGKAEWLVDEKEIRPLMRLSTGEFTGNLEQACFRYLAIPPEDLC